ncbi:MAG: alpha/beta hydrolase, partial [Rhodospirillales bacterium]|nr:alpha/beta hydrolase [Rhodospirillales bacterium]
MAGGPTAVLLLFISFLSACAPTLRLPGPPSDQPTLEKGNFTTSDGVRLPLHVWAPEQPPKAVLLALHGFNDYGSFIKKAGAFLAGQSVRVYAYDQRGFGRAPHRGIWAGWRAYGDDLTALTKLLRARHPGLPLFLLGSSMGGAVIMTAMTRPETPKVDGIILAAPAVWGRATMPFYQRWALWLSAHTVPWFTLTGEGLNIKASDNLEMLRALGRDPLIIKHTRVDTIWGLVNLMDKALAAAPHLRGSALILVAGKDEVITAGPTGRMLATLSPAQKANQKIIHYGGGFHMLLRDLKAQRVWQDVL